MDSRRARSGCWVSHGHTDHIAAHREFLATGPTGAVLRQRHARSQPQAIAYGQPVPGPGYRITLHPAGHCLGSAQMLIELEDSGKRIVYTGDFKLRPNPAAESASVLPCDTLIMEATFGQPHYCFPPEEEVLDELDRFIQRSLNADATPVLLAYTLGKAQEALHHLLARGYKVRYDPSIERAVALYREWGVQFHGDHRAWAGESLRGAVALLPPTARRGPLYQHIRKPRTAFLTGWALDEGARFRFRADAAFPLSDHADFPELVRYARESGASQVFTVNGFPHLAEHLRHLGIPARHLPEVSSPQQLTLSV